MGGTSASAAVAAEPFRGPRIGDFTDVILVAAAEEEVASSDIRETVFMGEKETGGLHRPPLWKSGTILLLPVIFPT